MELTPWRPSGELTRLRKEMDDLWNRFFGEVPAAIRSRWMPSVDISETDTEIQVRAELPGLDSKDIEVSVSGDILTIKGEKKEKKETKEESYHSRERYYGSFQRSVRLPVQVKSEEAKADFKNGILNLTLPKAESAKSRKIEIK